jgi:hypothetical protein
MNSVILDIIPALCLTVHSELPRSIFPSNVEANNHKQPHIGRMGIG